MNSAILARSAHIQESVKNLQIQLSIKDMDLDPVQISGQVLVLLIKVNPVRTLT